MPNPTHHVVTQVTMALVLVLLSACSLFQDSDPLEDLREQIQAAVHDQERASAMLDSVDEIDRLLLESAELLSAVARQNREIFADYDSTPQDFETVLSEAARKRMLLQDEMLDAHLKFKANATADEWNDLLPLYAAALSSRVQALVVAAVNQRR